jgi:hypothetical protein
VTRHAVRLPPRFVGDNHARDGYLVRHGLIGSMNRDISEAFTPESIAGGPLDLGLV